MHLCRCGKEHKYKQAHDVCPDCAKNLEKRGVNSGLFYVGQSVLVSNNNRDWKIKLYHSQSVGGPSDYRKTHTFKVCNKVAMEKTFRFKYCIPLKGNQHLVKTDY